MRRPSNVAAILAVVAVYFFFATAGTFRFALTNWKGSNYASLAEGFLHGRLSLMQQPEEDLTDLDNPYDPTEREDIPFVWDASLYNGRYYLYFSPVPVIIFYIPFELIVRSYPGDTLVAFVFSVVAFLFFDAFAARALREAKPRVPLWLWTLVIGAGNVVPYVLVNVRAYEVAVTAAMMFTAAWAYAVMRYLEKRSTAAAVWIGIVLALAIACRPNLAMLLVATAFVVARDRKAVVASAIPLAIVAAALLSYNAVRFRSPFELGTTYQLTTIDMHGRHVCCLCRPADFMRLVNTANEYVFMAPVIRSDFPLLRFAFSDLDPRLSFPGIAERTIGIAPLVPLAILGSLFALMFAREPADRPARIALLGSWLVLLGLSTCWWIVARYSLDFMQLMTAGAIIFVERALAQFPSRTFRALAIGLACYSVIAGVLLGFDDMFGVMRIAFPELYSIRLR